MSENSGAKIRVGLVNWSTKIIDGQLNVVGHWVIGSGADAERITTETELIPELSEEETLEVVKCEIKKVTARMEQDQGMGNPMGDGTELEPQRV